MNNNEDSRFISRPMGCCNCSCCPPVEILGPKCCVCATGPTGPTGPTGTSSLGECGCVNQMINIIQQIITLYPNNNIFVSVESGDLVFGQPGSLITGPDGNFGVFEVISGVSGIRQFVSLCSIDSIRIDNVAYNDTITFLPQPSPAPTGCQSNCESTIRSTLPVGTTNVSIITS